MSSYFSFSDFPYNILNRRPTEHLQLYPQLSVNPITTNIPNVHSDSTLNGELPHSENPSTTELPKLPNSDEGKYHAGNCPADTDQTLLKVLATDPAPLDKQSETPHPSTTERHDTTPEPTDSYSNTPSSGSEVSLHRVNLQRVQGAPGVLITVPHESREETDPEAGTSFIPVGQASPDSVVTEAFVDIATPDNTTKSSITPCKWNGYLYCRDVNRPEDDEAAMAIAPVHNIPRDFGIES